MTLQAITWKPVKIDYNILSGSVDGLIGIQECTDYSLQNIKKGSKRRSISDEGMQIKKKKTSRSRNKKNNILLEKESLTPSTCGTTNGVSEVEETIHKVEKDLTNLESWNSYGLPESILAGLKELKFCQPTLIQSLTLPSAILGRRNILGAAETGSGKTLAFGLPILTGILNIKEKSINETVPQDQSDSDESDFDNAEENGMGCVRIINNVDIEETHRNKPLYALILTPTRELAMQVKAHLAAVAKYTGIQIAVVVGGMAAVKQERILSKGPEIVVATPGRLWELIQQGNPHLSQIDNIKYLAIDETDRMLERGHFQELHDLLDRINMEDSKRKERQYFVFSATLTLVHELPNYLKNKRKIKRSKNIEEMDASQKLQKIVDMLGISNPKVVDVTEGKGTSETLTECRITCDIDKKDYYVYYFLKKHPGRTLIFCNSIGCVKRLAALLSILDCHPLPIHASMQQRQRLKNLERFRDNENSILVATDVAARGLDIPHVEHVLHYQTPRTSEGYVHRSGRTARASRQGITVLLIEPNELPNYLKLCRTLGKGEDLPNFPVQENLLNAVKKRVNLARELDKLQLHVRKANSEAGWFQKAAEDMDILVDDFSSKDDTDEIQKHKKIAELKRKQLATLLATPIFPSGFSGKYPLLSNSKLSFDGNIKVENAVEVMKSAMEADNKNKKKNIPLFKPKKKVSKNESGNVGLKKISFNLGKKKNTKVRGKKK
ncbi:unnamed protein product [Phaedon cochleariae]|uniref:ATP-dependent RNA helicase n=1 Tax=Phaedon cochleariae TaxID=80249 RepID=A0A9P0DT36_PHACE|nr:unnamed protein product [Phaedon cochleariae]